ncbi:MAG: hypothetical protein IJX69_04610 [Oscillospiraceae bacterium]|nr:hypothetical protein [Oscillospiraceae bacterium]
MIIDEDWGIAPDRIAGFFQNQPDVISDGSGFSYGQCRITLTAREGRAMGKWPIMRTQVRMEGPEGEVKAIHRRFFLQFLSAGG